VVDAATDATDATDTAEVDEADLADEAADASETTEADQADVANKPGDADEAKANGANKAKANEADDEANGVLDNQLAELEKLDAPNKAIVSNKAGKTDVVNKSDEAILIDAADKSLANGIAIILYSVFAEDKGYIGMTISNNQLVGTVWSCSRSLKCQHLQRADIEDGKLLSFSMRVRLCFVLSLQM